MNSGVQRGRPRIRDDDPSDPNRGNSEILRQRQRARQRREKEREQRSKAARLTAECDQLRRALLSVRNELCCTQQELTAIKDAKERVEFERICDQVLITDLKQENANLKWRLGAGNISPNNEQRVYYNL